MKDPVADRIGRCFCDALDMGRVCLFCNLENDRMQNCVAAFKPLADAANQLARGCPRSYPKRAQPHHKRPRAQAFSS